MKELILSILSNDVNITNIEDKSFMKMYAHRSYEYIYKFTYNNLQKTGIPVILGIPVSWDRKLIDVYIEKYGTFKYIPHLELNGKLCLFDIEGVLIDKYFEGLLIQTLERLKTVLHDGLNDLNKEDFIIEFERYWDKLPNAKALKSMIYCSEDTKLIKYADNQKDIEKKKNDTFVDIFNKKNRYHLVCSDTEKDFNVYKDINNLRNGIYIHIDAEHYIYPPDWRNRLKIEYINSLLRDKSIDRTKLIQSLNKTTHDLMLVFNIKQPNAHINIFGVLIKGYSINAVTLQINSCRELIPCAIERCDKEFLLNRGGAISQLTNKKILIIGCGSIGGYLVSEIIKTGFNSITLVDADLLKEENIYRHLLGMEYAGKYKSKAIEDYINKNIPGVTINSYQDTIEDIIQDESISFSDYDLVISAVGNHNVNRWINQFMHENNLEIPVLYLWNEALGIGNHGALISTKFQGCYECFFGRGEDDTLYDKTSYCEKGQVFTKRLMGCGSSFMPFSSINSITTVSLGIKLLKEYFNDNINCNLLMSLKGDEHYFKELGFKSSNRYNVQKEVSSTLEGDKFKQKRCSICGDK